MLQHVRDVVFDCGVPISWEEGRPFTDLDTIVDCALAGEECTCVCLGSLFVLVTWVIGH
jgi:hypothetical protein